MGFDHDRIYEPTYSIWAGVDMFKRTAGAAFAGALAAERCTSVDVNEPSGCMLLLDVDDGAFGAPQNEVERGMRHEQDGKQTQCRISFSSRSYWAILTPRSRCAKREHRKPWSRAST